MGIIYNKGTRVRWKNGKMWDNMAWFDTVSRNICFGEIKDQWESKKLVFSPFKKLIIYSFTLIPKIKYMFVKTINLKGTGVP